MTLPVCAVQCYVYTQDGDPVEGATLSAKLTHYEVYQGHVVPNEMTALTDVDGLAVLNLWPNELGSTGSSYKVKIDPPGKKSLTVFAVVPLALEANLSEIATLPVYEGKPDGQIGVELANAALVAANNAVISAASSASTAASQAGIATAQAGAAAGSASSASTSAGTATTQAGISTAAAGTATTQAGIATTKAAEAAASAASLVLTGCMAMFARNTAPTGWLKANGALVSRATYSDLFSAIGTTFGAGNGSTTFAIPDLRGEFARGWDDSRGIDAGRVFGSAQAHSTEDLYAAVNIEGTPSPKIGRIPTPPWTAAISTAAGDAALWSGTQTNGSAVGRLNTGVTRPRNIALLACIKY